MQSPARPSLLFAIFLACLFYLWIGASALAFQEPCLDCSSERQLPGVVRNMDRPGSFTVPPDPIIHNPVTLQRDRHRECVQGLEQIQLLVGQLQRLTVNPQLTPAELPKLKKSFKKASKAVDMNCF